MNNLLEQMFKGLGALRAEVTERGIATHWPTRALAEMARDKLREMCHHDFKKEPERLELFRDGEAWAVFIQWQPNVDRAKMVRRFTV